MITFLNQIYKDTEFHNQWYYTIACFSYTINFSLLSSIAQHKQLHFLFGGATQLTAFLIDLVIQHKQLQFIIDHVIKNKKELCLSFEKVIEYTQ